MSAFLDTFIASAQQANRSQRFIELGAEYINRLEARNYPIFFSLEHFAMAVGMPSRLIKKHLVPDTNSYSYFKLKKRRGGFREIITPKDDLKYIQRWLLANILVKYPLTPACTGFVKGSSIVNNASCHSRKKYILKIDLLKFYDTITQKRVFGVFKTMGYAPNLAYDFAKLVTAPHLNRYWDSFTSLEKQILNYFVESKPSVLPQGAPTSPMISNIVANRLDKRMRGLGELWNFSYSRYADDLTFSANRRQDIPHISFLYDIIYDEGFFPNKAKTTMAKRGMKQYVTGLTVTNGVHTSKHYRREIFSHLHFSKKFGPLNHLNRWKHDQNTQQVMNAFQDWLLGSISHVMAVDKVVGMKMMAEFNKINWAI